MSRITQCLDNARQHSRKLLVPYIVAGDPAIEVTVPVMHALVKAGADVIELGVPFSDPMAEGPTIQLAHERALVNGVTLRKVLAMVTEFRVQDDRTPVVLMGYTNPIEHMGYVKFATAAQAAGVDGVLLVDTPAEEANELHTALQHAGIDNIFLLAPTTVAERIRITATLATGYLYYVSLKGVTGAGNLDVDDVRKHIDNIRLYTSLPVCVGFGIKDAASAKAVATLADGVVVGSVLVQKMASLGASTAANTIASEVAKLVTELRQAIDSEQ